MRNPKVGRIRVIASTHTRATVGFVYRFEAEVWLWEAAAAWHFLTLPGDVSDDIEGRSVDQARGFGSVRVRVTIGSSTCALAVVD